jgi:hypothetical protein
MSNQTPQTLASYKRVFRAICYFVCAMPIGGWLTHHRFAFIFPPLGNGALEGFATTTSTLLAGIAAILPWKLRINQNKDLILASAFLLTLISTVLFFYLTQEYVISVPLPNGSALTVSVGNVRSEFALSNFPETATDTELLQAEGPYEDQVQKLWTRASIISVRLRLFLTYLGWLVPLNLVLGILSQAEPAAAARKPKTSRPRSK